MITPPRIAALALSLAVLHASSQLLYSAKEKEPDSAAKTSMMLIDLSKPGKNLEIRVVNDGVMGGLSQGSARTTDDGTLLFDGNLSLKNNGGFSSLRMDAGQVWDLEGWSGVELRIKGDGRSYGFRATTDQRYRWSSVSFTTDFQTTKDTWTTVRVPFSSMKATWRGRQLDRPFDPAKIRSLGIILSDKKAGPFHLEIASLSTWGLATVIDNSGNKTRP